MLMRWLVSASIFLIFSSMSVTGLAGTRSDTAKEQRWSEQIIDTLFDGDVVWLDTEDHTFLGVEMEAEDSAENKAVIVVHGIGVHPNWEQVIRPLRVELTQYGWQTLSIQMPILPNEAEPNDYYPLFEEVSARFNAAVTYLNKQGISEIVIAAHSMGAAMTSQYLAENPDAPIKAAVLIGMDLHLGSEKIDLHPNIISIRIPILDLYGSEDLPNVTGSSSLRADAAKAGGNAHYEQITVDGANHFFDGKEETLIDTVKNWLQQTD